MILAILDSVILYLIVVMLESLDFLPGELNGYLRALIYILIIVHVLAFTAYFVLVCPGLFKKNDSFSDRVDKMIQKNKEKQF